MGREIGLTLTIDRMATGSYQIKIGVGSDCDSKTDPDLSSKPIGVDSAKSSSESSNSMGGGIGFAFRRIGNLRARGGGANRCKGCWGGCCEGCDGGGGADCCGVKGRIGC